MSKLDILQLGSPTLHAVCAPLDARAPSMVALARDVPDTRARRLSSGAAQPDDRRAQRRRR